MGKKCCKDVDENLGYVVLVDGDSFYGSEIRDKENAEETIAEFLLDYSEDQIKVYKTVVVDWETEQKQVEVTIID